MIEIKEPSSARRGIEAAIRKAIKQILAIHDNLDNGIVVVSLDNIIDATIEEGERATIRRAGALGVQNLIIISKGKTIYKRIKK